MRRRRSASRVSPTNWRTAHASSPRGHTATTRGEPFRAHLAAARALFWRADRRAIFSFWRRDVVAKCTGGVGGLWPGAVETSLVDHVITYTESAAVRVRQRRAGATGQRCRVALPRRCALSGQDGHAHRQSHPAGAGDAACRAHGGASAQSTGELCAQRQRRQRNE